MKKFSTFFLALTLAAGTVVPASAEEVANYKETFEDMEVSLGAEFAPPKMEQDCRLL